ncbi:hypothetical protein K493DRAFT_340347 [Basidiobolus meristosporus CBS 931.73]|uniref:Uncharacterized protein n=1 Tax=Basidiobolus meristosporus CBS 931.73 TaxID=1314790 RepID=A0A1Y1XVZ0_9FUNG|nr:hypothetical protein K493DRAFT_340347 [Basidiobolus meristosporus CBS 931.73]|eukprot:ORX89893.1 hypothetical protein K493DRAFT_340347 [Basidiobolus meristosporus CBS 931.73]
MGKDSSIMTSMQGFPNFKGAKPPKGASTPSKIRSMLEEQQAARVSSSTPGRLPKNGPIILRPGEDGLFSPVTKKLPSGGYAKSELGFYPSNPNRTRSDDGFGSDSSDSSNRASVLSVKTDVNRRTRPLSMSRYSSIPHRGQSEDLEAKEARTNRKIMDLEISNSSLLSINASLESTIKKQTAQIEQLERRISRGGPMDLAALDVPLPNWEDITLSPTEEEDNIDLVNDQVFARVCTMVDSLISDAKKSLEYKTQVNGGKVLTTFNSDENGKEPYEEISRDLSDIGEEEEQELNDSIEDSTSEEPLGNVEMGCQTEPADLTDSGTQTEANEQRIKELINQILDLTNKQPPTAAKSSGQKPLNPTSSVSSSESIHTMLTHLKEQLCNSEDAESAPSSFTPTPNVQSRTRPRSSISNPSTPLPARSRKTQSVLIKTTSKAPHPESHSSPNSHGKIKTRV